MELEWAPEPEPEIELDLDLAQLVLEPASVEESETSARERRLSPPRSANVEMQALSLGDAMSASPHILNLTDCDDKPSLSPVHTSSCLVARRAVRKGSILDLISQLGTTLRTASRPLEGPPLACASLEGFALDVNRLSGTTRHPRKPLREPEVWDPSTQKWRALPTLGTCSEASRRRSRRGTRSGCRGSRGGINTGNRGAKRGSGGCNEATSRSLLWVSPNRGSIRRLSKQAGRGRGTQNRPAKPICMR